MRQHALLLLAALAAVGCQQAPPLENPFLGRTTIPAPGTTGAGVPPATPYYPGAPFTPPAATPGPGNGYVPPGGTFSPNQSGFGSWRAPASANRALAATSASTWGYTAEGLPATGPASQAPRWSDPTSASPSQLAGSGAAAPSGSLRPTTGGRFDPTTADNRFVESTARQPYGTYPGPTGHIRVDPPTGRPAAQVAARVVDQLGGSDGSPRAADPYTVAGSEPGRFVPPRGAIDITQLPPPRTPIGQAAYAVDHNLDDDGEPWDERARDERTERAHGRGRTVETSYDGDDERFDFDPDYAWLAGRLEYVQRSQRWVLRYLPSHGPSDDFGGSLALADSPLLEGLRPGEFVVVEGRLRAPAAGAGRVAPLYEIEAIEPLGEP